MAASVRLTPAAFADPRFVLLARLAGLADRDHALIKTARVWSHATDRETHTVAPDIVDIVSGVDGFASALVNAELAEETQRGIYLRGGKDHLLWLATKRKASKKGGDSFRKRMEARRRPGGLPEARPDVGLVAQPKVGPIVIATAIATTTALVTSKKKKANDFVVPGADDQPTQVLNEVDQKRKEAKQAKLALEREATVEAVELFNRVFERNLSPTPWAESVRKVLARGFTPDEIKAVVWWAGQTWSEDPKMRADITPKTLLKLVSSQGYRTFPEYLGCASELWRETHEGQAPPWEPVPHANGVQEVANGV